MSAEGMSEGMHARFSHPGFFVILSDQFADTGVAGVISGKFSVREMAPKSPLVARHDYI
jgi:hypothetical protein